MLSLLHDATLSWHAQLTDSKPVVQLKSTMLANIQKIAGPVAVRITSIRTGSVVVTSVVDFLNGNQAAAAAYMKALESDTSSIFGTAYGTTVDANSIKEMTEANPSKQSDLSP